MSYLADTSAVWRLSRRRIPEPRPTHVARGLVAMCPPVEAELMTGVRADRVYEPFLLSVLRWTFGSYPALHAVQRDLIAIGHHRGPSQSGLRVGGRGPARYPHDQGRPAVTGGRSGLTAGPVRR